MNDIILKEKEKPVIKDESWLYRANNDSTVKYLCLVPYASESIVMGAIKPFIDKRKTYLYHADQAMVAEYPDNIFRFGVTNCIKGIEELGYCYRCGFEGELRKTALMCPRCLTVIGGF